MVHRTFAHKFHFWFNFIMMLIYALVGILMIFVIHFDFLPEINTRLLGGILLLYAIYRGYKLLKTGNVRIESDQAHVTE